MSEPLYWVHDDFREALLANLTTAQIEEADKTFDRMLQGRRTMVQAISDYLATDFQVGEIVEHKRGEWVAKVLPNDRIPEWFNRSEPEPDDDRYVAVNRTFRGPECYLRSDLKRSNKDWDVEVKKDVDRAVFSAVTSYSISSFDQTGVIPSEKQVLEYLASQPVAADDEFGQLVRDDMKRRACEMMMQAQNTLQPKPTT